MTDKKVAPEPGVDPEFDEMFTKVWEVVTDEGNPEELTEEDAREKTWAAFARWRSYDR